MTTHAQGPFDVTLNPQTPWHASLEGSLGRMSLDKRFYGPLEAASKGEMLSVRGTEEGSAGYVAMEIVTGVLNGRSGSFALQHSASMTRGAPQLNITVVPDSGTGDLTGLSGRMDIVIEGGQHSYVFDYDLP